MADETLCSWPVKVFTQLYSCVSHSLIVMSAEQETGQRDGGGYEKKLAICGKQAQAATQTDRCSFLVEIKVLNGILMTRLASKIKQKLPI